eukprot:3531758-Pyramimonas_sp.AAC.1
MKEEEEEKEEGSPRKPKRSHGGLRSSSRCPKKTQRETPGAGPKRPPEARTIEKPPVEADVLLRSLRTSSPSSSPR